MINICFVLLCDRTDSHCFEDSKRKEVAGSELAVPSVFSSCFVFPVLCTTPKSQNQPDPKMNIFVVEERMEVCLVHVQSAPATMGRKSLTKPRGGVVMVELCAFCPGADQRLGL